MERIFDELNNSAIPNENEVTTERMRNKIKHIKTDFKKFLSPQDRFKKQIFSPKNLYPELHRKSHLKAALTIANNQASCFQD